MAMAAMISGFSLEGLDTMNALVTEPPVPVVIPKSRRD
jgi:hypothetical protein